MVKPNNTNNGVIFNIDLTGKIKDSNAGKLSLFVTMLIGSDVYLNKIRFYGCVDSGASRNCQDRSHYSQLIGDLDIAYINQVKIATLQITKVDATLASVSLNTGSAQSIKYYPTQENKLFIRVVGCETAGCPVQSDVHVGQKDFYIGGIYSYMCKNNIFKFSP